MRRLSVCHGAAFLMLKCRQWEPASQSEHDNDEIRRFQRCHYSCIVVTCFFYPTINRGCLQRVCISWEEPPCTATPWYPPRGAGEIGFEKA